MNGHHITGNLFKATMLLLFFLALLPSNSRAAVVVIDPAYGGSEFGGSGCDGLLAKEVTFRMGRLLYARAKEAKWVDEVFLTRNGDYPMTWQERVSRANQKRATVFVNLAIEHAPSSMSSGVRLYALLPDLQNSTSPVVDRSSLLGWGPTSLDEVAFSFLADSDRLLTEIEVHFSERAAADPQSVPVSTLRDLFLPLLGVKAAAVMVGLGFFSNAGDCARLQGEAHLGWLADTLLEAIKRYHAATGSLS